MRDDLFEGVVQREAHGVVNDRALVLDQIPLGEQLHLAAQQRLVIRWQHTGFGGQLPGQQCVHRLHVQVKIGLRLLAVDDLHHGLPAQIGQQHEALGLVPGQHLGCVHTGIHHHLGHFGKRPAVLFVGRCVHDDAAALGGINAEIAPETGVGRGQSQRLNGQLVGGRHADQPGVEGRLARCIRPGRSGVQDGCGGGGLAHG